MIRGDRGGSRIVGGVVKREQTQSLPPLQAGQMKSFPGTLLLLCALAAPRGAGAFFHVPHGLSNALVLPHVLRFNAPDAAADYAMLAPHVFPEQSVVDEPEARAHAFADELGHLSNRLGLQSTLREVGITAADLPKMASDAMKQTRLLVNNPRPVSEADALAIYEAAL